MSIPRCPICNQFILNPRHRCDPAWLVLIAPDDDYYAGDDDPTLIRAHDAEAAAIEFVRNWDKDEGAFPIADGEPITVLVSQASYPDDAPTQQRFIVTGEWDPHYCAAEQSVHSADPCSNAQTKTSTQPGFTLADVAQAITELRATRQKQEQPDDQ